MPLPHHQRGGVSLGKMTVGLVFSGAHRPRTQTTPPPTPKPVVLPVILPQPVPSNLNCAS